MNFSRHCLLAISLAAVLGASPAFGAEETRSVPAFTAVHFGGAGEVTVAVGKDQSVTLEGDKDLLERVTTEVRDGALEIKRENRSWWWNLFGFSDENKLTVRITVPRLTALSIAGAAKAAVTGVDGDHMAFSVAGAGKIQADGHVENLSLSIAGAGDADLDHLASTEAAVSIVGAGKVNLQAKNNLAASITGAGTIRYTGNPHVSSNITGAGTVERE